MRFCRLFSSLFVGLLTLTWTAGHSPRAQVCEPNDPQIALQYLRRLSLDLRGHVPSVEEMQAVLKEGKVDDGLIDKMLQSDGLRTNLRNYHTDLLWANISNLRITGASWTMNGNGTTSPISFGNQTRRLRYRGGPVNGAYVSCLNEPAQYDASKSLLCKLDSDGSMQPCAKLQADRKYGAGPAAREGFVMIRPYWDPSKEFKVCALDAQDSETVTFDGKPYTCATTPTPTNCGAGSGLRWGQLGTTTQIQIMNAFNDQMLHTIDDIIAKDKPYTDLLLGTETAVNGPISHFLRYQSPLSPSLYIRPLQNYTVPEIPFHEATTWLPVKQTHLAAGILSLPGYLFKFASNRGRANRFYNAFLCRFFQAPAGGLPAANDNCHTEPNLMKRCGCKFCHTSVEPAASHWGRWIESGLLPMHDTASYPEFKQACAGPNAKNDTACRRLYFVDPQHPDEERYKGYLLSYVFASKEMIKSIEQGPSLLAKQAIDSGDFARCSTRKLWSWFVGQDALPQQEDRIQKIADAFKTSQYNLKSLIKILVTSPEYQRGRLSK